MAWTHPLFLRAHAVWCNCRRGVLVCCAALATEPPTPGLLLEKPHGRDEALISPSMWKHIFCQGMYQLFWLFLVVYGATKVVGSYQVGCIGS